MTEGSQDYDREYTTQRGTTIRRRVGYSHDHGEVTRFVVQLEYLYGSKWTTVVRYDHDPVSLHGHDVTDEGLHIDVFRNGEKHRREYVAPPMPASVAFDFAEDHLAENIQQFTRRFEKWHEIRSQ